MLAYVKRDERGKWELIDWNVLTVTGCLENLPPEVTASTRRKTPEWDDIEARRKGETCIERLLRRDGY